MTYTSMDSPRWKAGAMQKVLLWLSLVFVALVAMAQVDPQSLYHGWG